MSTNDERSQPTAEERPPHPLVIDEKTKLCRYITDADVRRMETVCKAYTRLVASLRRHVEYEDVANGR